MLYAPGFDGELKIETCFGLSVARMARIVNIAQEKFGEIDKNEVCVLCRVYKVEKASKNHIFLLTEDMVKNGTVVIERAEYNSSNFTKQHCRYNT